MKRLLVFAFACVFAAGGIACKEGNPESPDESPADSSGTGTVGATVDGGTFSASGKANVIATRSPGNNFSIAATSSSGARLSVVMTGVAAPGTYSLGFGGVGAGQYTSGSSVWLSSLSGGTGTVTFTTLTTTHATGTFSFTGSPVAGTNATGSKAVTSGSFDVSLGT